MQVTQKDLHMRCRVGGAEGGDMQLTHLTAETPPPPYGPKAACKSPNAGWELCYQPLLVSSLGLQGLMEMQGQLAKKVVPTEALVGE